MKTLITGASGFVGAAVLRRLLDKGHAVRALVRPSSPRSNLAGLDVEVMEGDLTDPASLKQAVAGCEAMYHVAADYRLWTRNPEEMYQSNVTGTRHILQAAGEAGVKRIVYTSSVAVLGLHPDGAPADEETPSTLKDMIGHYKRSKFLAEEEVRRIAKDEGLPVVIVNPSTPIGPRDIKPTPTGRTIRDAAHGRIPAYVDTGLNLVHVDDVAEGHLLAFERGQIGERYILGGHNLTLRQILEAIAQITGRPGPRIRLTHEVIMPIAYASEFWAWLTHGPEPRVTRDAVRMSRKLMFFSSEKAQRALGYQTRPVEQALRDAVAWFLSGTV